MKFGGWGKREGAVKENYVKKRDSGVKKRVKKLTANKGGQRLKTCRQRQKKGKIGRQKSGNQQ